MADIRIKDLATTATTTASDDFMAVDGSTNGTRKMNAAAPAFLTSVTTPSLTSPASTNLTLAGGAGNSSIILTPAGTGGVGIGTTTPASFMELKAAAGTLHQRFTDATTGLIGLIGGANGILTGAGANTMGVRAENGLFLSGAGNTNTHLVLNSSSQVLIGTTDATGLTGTGGLKIASATAGSAGAGALVVTGGLSAGNNGNASYFGGAVTASNGITLGSGKLLLGGNGEILAGQDSGGYYFANGAGATTNVPINIGDAASLQVFRTSASAAAGSRRLVLGPAGTFGLGGTITNTSTMLGAAISYDNTTVAVNIAATFAGAVSVGGALKLGNAYVGTPVVGTGYIVIQDSNGTNYKVSVAAL